MHDFRKIPYAFLIGLCLFFVLQATIIHSKSFWKWAYLYSDNFDTNDGIIFESQLRTMPQGNELKKVFLIGTSLAQEGLDVNYFNSALQGNGACFYKLGFHNGSMLFSIFMQKDRLLREKPYAMICIVSGGPWGERPSDFARNTMKYYFDPAIAYYMIRYLGIWETLTYSNSFIDSVLGEASPLYRFRDAWSDIFSNWAKGRKMARKEVLEIIKERLRDDTNRNNKMVSGSGQGTLADRYAKMNTYLFDLFADEVLANNIRFIVIEAPLRPDYQNTVHEAIGFAALIKKLSGNKEFTYIPRTELPVFAVQDFSDSLHLNKRGRDKLSAFVAEYLIRKGIIK